MRISPKSPHLYPWYIRIFFYFQKKRFGNVLNPNWIWARKPKLLFAMALFNNALNDKKSKISPSLKSLLMTRVSQINHCSFCIDLNSALFLNSSHDLNKLQALHSWKDNLLFSPIEQLSLQYAEAITDPLIGVSNNLFNQLKQYFDDDSIIELTALITFQNLSSKFNHALDVPSQGLCPTKQTTTHLPHSSQ